MDTLEDFNFTDDFTFILNDPSTYEIVNDVHFESTTNIIYHDLINTENIFNEQNVFDLNNQYSFENLSNSPSQSIDNSPKFMTSNSSSPLSTYNYELNSFNLEPVQEFDNTQIVAIPDTSKVNQSLSINLPEMENDGIKKQIEIILNFDKLNDVNIEELKRHFSDSIKDNLKIVVEDKKETCIDLDESFEMTNYVDETSNEVNKNTK